MKLDLRKANLRGIDRLPEDWHLLVQHKVLAYANSDLDSRSYIIANELAANTNLSDEDVDLIRDWAKSCLQAVLDGAVQELY